MPDFSRWKLAGAELIESAGQELRNFRGLAGFDVPAMHHVDRLAVFEESDGRRGRRKVLENVAEVRNGRFVAACENGGCAVRLHGVLQRHADTGSGAACGAAANGIDNHQGGSRGGQNAIDIGGCSGLFQTELGQVFAHGRDEHFRIRHRTIIAYGCEILRRHEK